jgi:hypothetical protein
MVVNLFLKHVENTIGEPDEQRILIDFMAFVYQNPGKRVKWALLLQGIEGNGKSYFFNVMERLLGARSRVVSSGAINSDFTGWAEGSLLIGIEEIRVSGTNKYAILDKMKPLLTNDIIPVVHKNKNESGHVPNFTSYMMFTNHADAIPVGDNDRRYCAIFTRQTQQQDLFDQHGGREGAGDYFSRLFSESQRRSDALARFLADWEVSPKFDPAGRAPETKGIHKMRALNVSEEKDEVETAIEDNTCPVIGPDLLDVTYLNDRMVMETGGLPRTRALSHILTDKGYTQIDSRRMMINRTRRVHYVWYREGRHTSQSAKEAVRSFHESPKQPDFTDAPF